MANQTYHMLHDTEKSKTICGRPIEVNGRPKVLLTASAEKKHGTVCGRCKALLAGKAKTEKVTAKHQKIREAAPAEKKERKVGKRQPALLALGEKMPSELRVTFKGKEHLAAVNPDGTILVEGHEQPFNSPSRAGKAVTGREVDGWTFWRFEVEGEGLKKLDTLRKHDQEGK
jgi:hypothetical protein